MLIIILFIKISLINCNLNITDTANKIKYILNNCNHSKFKRCSVNAKINDYVGKTLNVLERTEYIGNCLKYFNVSQCSGKRLHSGNYISKHILNGLLLHEDVPDSHWQEYKVSYCLRDVRSYHHINSYCQPYLW